MSVNDLGAVPASTTIYLYWTSHDLATGANETMSGLAVGDILIYKNGSTTQRSSTAGFTLLDTDGIDFDALTGVNGVSIDLSDNTDAGFYAVGSWYTVILGPVTIDTQTVYINLATFRIVAAEAITGKPKVDVDGWLGTAAATPTVAGVPEVDITHIGGTAVTAAAGIPEVKVASLATGAITAGAIAADAIGASELAADAVTEIAAPILAVLGALNDAAADGAVTATDTMVAYLKQIINTLEGTPGIPTWPASAAPGNAVSIAEAIRSIYDQIGVAGAGLTAADDAVITAIAGLDTKLDTIDNYIDTEIATLITMLTGIVPVNGTIGATGNSTTALHLSGIAWADDAPNSMLLTIKDVSTGLFYSRWIEAFADATDLATVATLPFTPEASVDLYWLTPVRADVTGGSGLDAAGVRAAIGLASANLDTQLTAIDDYIDTEVAAIKAKTDNLPASPAATGDIPTAAAIADAVWDEDATAHQTQGTFGQAIGDPAADVGTIYKATVTDANSATVGLDTDWLITHMGVPSNLGGGATLAANLSDIEGQTDDIGAAGAGLTALASAADLATLTGYVDTEVAAIKAKTDQLTFTTANQVDAQVLSMAANALTAAATAADFGTEVATAVWASATRTLSALGFTLGASDLAADTIGASELAADAITEIVNAVLTTAMTESYNADGAAPTLAQALFVTMQRLTEFAISGTTITVNKLDGTTAAYTLTLDDATSPTSSERAT